MFRTNRIEGVVRATLFGRNTCPWCGGVPRVRLTKDPINATISLKFRCHYRTHRVTFTETAAQDTERLVDFLLAIRPFPLPRVSPRLGPVMPRGWIVQADGTRAWVMGPSE